MWICQRCLYDALQVPPIRQRKCENCGEKGKCHTVRQEDLREFVQSEISRNPITLDEFNRDVYRKPLGES